MKITLNRIKIILGFCIALSITTIIFYIINFSGFNIAKDTQTWGAFGDYIGGFVSAIVGVANLVLLVAIATFVEKLNTHRHLNEFRYYALAALHNQFDNLNYSSGSFESFKHQIDNFYKRNSFLFQNIDEFKTPIKMLSERLSEETAVLKTHERREKKGECKQVDEEELGEFQDIKIKPDDPMLEIKNLFDDIIALIQKQILIPN